MDVSFGKTRPLAGLIGRLTADPQTHAGEKHESATF